MRIDVPNRSCVAFNGYNSNPVGKFDPIFTSHHHGRQHQHIDRLPGISNLSMHPCCGFRPRPHRCFADQRTHPSARILLANGFWGTTAFSSQSRRYVEHDNLSGPANKASLCQTSSYPKPTHKISIALPVAYLTRSPNSETQLVWPRPLQ